MTSPLGRQCLAEEELCLAVGVWIEREGIERNIRPLLQ